jgi:N-acyl-D-aspartate/D-glutamate deacylase
MPPSDTLIHDVQLIDGSGRAPFRASVAITAGRIEAIGDLSDYTAEQIIDGRGLALAPGFIDAHTHDDTAVLRSPSMLPKLSQGITTVVVGNCGISASPVALRGDPPDPMNLLGGADAFRYPTFASYIGAVEAAQPALNVAALIGHTALRNNHMDRLDRAATTAEIERMRAQLHESLAEGALGLSTGLAYLSANAATSDEVLALAEPLAKFGGIYATHMRSETEAILDAMDEAFRIGQHAQVPVVISHLKCAGLANWGRSTEVLEAFDEARRHQAAGCDCYPYAAGSSTLDLRQVDERVRITITWSEPHPDAANRLLAEIAEAWGVSQLEAASRLQPAGAIYHSISEEDMRRILAHPATMIGSDGLPGDPHPHPRLWGTFPRVLGVYSRQLELFPLHEAIHKMTGLTAQRFGLRNRGLIREGYAADLVLFNPETVQDAATFESPQQPSIGIEAVWVNGALSYARGAATGQRAGTFLRRKSPSQV